MKIAATPSVDSMLRAIERKVCIRKIWRCNAGWGIFFCIYEKDMPELYRKLRMEPNAVIPSDNCYIEEQRQRDLAQYGRCKTVIFTYADTLTQCIQDAYKYWVEGEEVDSYPRRV
jgi:hypothetical protein